MKTAMKRTVFTVKLRKMDYKEEWSLYIEAFPVFVANKKNPVRQHETLNRYVTTPIWDKNSVSKTRNDKSITVRNVTATASYNAVRNKTSSRASLPSKCALCVNMNMTTDTSTPTPRQSKWHRTSVLIATSSAISKN